MGIGDTLTQKLGPLPVWAWVGIGGIAGWYFIIHKKTKSPISALGQGTGGAPTGGNQGFDFGAGGGGGGSGTSTSTTPTSGFTQTPQDVINQVMGGIQFYSSPLYQASIAVANGTATQEQRDMLSARQQQVSQEQSQGYTIEQQLQHWEQQLGLSLATANAQSGQNYIQGTLQGPSNLYNQLFYNGQPLQPYGSTISTALIPPHQMFPPAQRG